MFKFLTWTRLRLRRLLGTQKAYPEDFANRDEDKFNYRYRGNCYIRLELSPTSHRHLSIRRRRIISGCCRSARACYYGARETGQYINHWAPGSFIFYQPDQRRTNPNLPGDIALLVCSASSYHILAWLTVLLRYAYFHNLTQADLPYIKIPLHTVIKLTPKAYGCDEERCSTQS